MKRVHVFVLACSGAAALAAALLGCNGLLGIGSASLEPDAGAVEAGPQGPSCQLYCSTIVQNCTQQFAEYTGSEDPTELCMAMCPVWDVGFSIGPTNDDTVGCRIYYAQQAATDPATNCRKAGPLGGGVCGAGSSPCQDFCSLDVQYCNNAPVNTPQYASTNDCMAACADGGYPYLVPPPDAGCGGSDYDLLDCSNTLNCRWWHLENAYGSSANGQFHCPHTQQQSPVCR